jgi:alpha-galactosidase/6-phospho-beta-glucosidase family protein
MHACVQYTMGKYFRRQIYKSNTCLFLVFQTQTCLRTKFWLEDVILGNKTVRHPLKKTVQHQDSSGTVEKVSNRHAALTKAAFVVRPNHLENKQSPMPTQAVNI